MSKQKQYERELEERVGRTKTGKLLKNDYEPCDQCGTPTYLDDMVWSKTVDGQDICKSCHEKQGE